MIENQQKIQEKDDLELTKVANAVKTLISDSALSDVKEKLQDLKDDVTEFSIKEVFI